MLCRCTSSDVSPPDRAPPTLWHPPELALSSDDEGDQVDLDNVNPPLNHHEGGRSIHTSVADTDRDMAGVRTECRREGKSEVVHGTAFPKTEHQPSQLQRHRQPTKQSIGFSRHHQKDQTNKVHFIVLKCIA